MDRKFDLEERTQSMALRIRDYIKALPKTLTNLEYARQLTRSSGSVAANYIEANEAVSRKDFVLRLRIARKECKETNYWLRMTEPSEMQAAAQKRLSEESTELVRIFSAIIERTIANSARVSNNDQ